MTWQIEFESADFRPYLPEECQSNPGAYGFELALWLSQTLAKRGVVTSYPIGEDWGWLLEHIDSETEFMIGCASLSDDGEGYTGKPIRWRVFVRPTGSLSGWLRRKPPPDASRLEAEISGALRDGGYHIERSEADPEA